MGNRHGTDGAPKFNDEMIAEFCKTSGMTENQVRDHCSSFLYDHPDGKLEKEFFRRMLTQSLKDFSTEELQKLEDHIFRIYDSNGDGVVDFHEFMTVFMILTGDEPRSVLEKIFLIFDVDNSGLITKDNMMTLVSDLHKLFIDSTGDEEREEELASLAFSEMDTDEDGGVTRDEFVFAILSREKFSSYLTHKIFNLFG